MIAQRYPLIIVDEAQDTNGDAWKCIEMLAAETTTILCLADLEQQIFDYPQPQDSSRRHHAPVFPYCPITGHYNL